MNSLGMERARRRARKRSLYGKSAGICDRKGCRAPAAFRIMFRIWPRRALPGITPPIEGDMSLVVCAEHAQEVKADEFFTDHAWPQIVEGFRRDGLAEPDRTSAQVYLKELH